MKNNNSINEEIKHLLIDKNKNNYTLFHAYHFNGFGKSNEVLENFIKTFMTQHNILLDKVYTAKTMYGLKDLINKKYFTTTDKVLFIHSGGIQGNRM